MSKIVKIIVTVVLVFSVAGCRTPAATVQEAEPVTTPPAAATTESTPAVPVPTNTESATPGEEDKDDIVPGVTPEPTVGTDTSGAEEPVSSTPGEEDEAAAKYIADLMPIVIRHSETKQSINGIETIVSGIPDGSDMDTILDHFQQYCNAAASLLSNVEQDKTDALSLTPPRSHDDLHDQLLKAIDEEIKHLTLKISYYEQYIAEQAGDSAVFFSAVSAAGEASRLWWQVFWPALEKITAK